MVSNLKKEDEAKMLEALQDVWGVHNVNINTKMNEVIFTFNEESGSVQDFEQAVIDLGYKIEK